MAVSSSTTTSATSTISTTTITRKPRLKRGSRPHIYHAESTSRPGVYHVVDVHRLSCSCPAGRFKRACHHIKLCLAWHDWRLRQQVVASSTAPAGMAALQEAFA
jgi:hypothetical protein